MIQLVKPIKYYLSLYYISYSTFLLNIFIIRIFIISTIGILDTWPVVICLFKGSKWNTRTISEIYSKLTIKTLGRRCSVVTIVKFEQTHTLFWCFHCWFWTSKYRLGDSIFKPKTCLKLMITTVQVLEMQHFFKSRAAHDDIAVSSPNLIWI